MPEAADSQVANEVKVYCAVLCLAAVIFGIYLRLSNLTRTPLWHDEIYTMVQSSGRAPGTAVLEIQGKGIIQASELESYLKPSAIIADPRSVIHALASEEPQHPPLYYLIASAWRAFTGYGPGEARALSVVIGVLLVAMAAVFAGRGCNSWLAGSIAAAVISGSLYHFRISMDFRGYVLWALFTLASSWSLMALYSKRTKLSSYVYCLFLTMGYYTSPLMFFVHMAHFLYLLISHERRVLLRRFLFDSVVCLLLYLPWIATIFLNRDQVYMRLSWLKEPLAFAELMPYLGQSVIEFFFIGYEKLSAGGVGLFYPLIVGFNALLLLCLLVSMLARRDGSYGRMLLLLIFCSFVFMFAADMILGGRRSMNMRYFTSTVISLQLLFAYCIYKMIQKWPLTGAILYSALLILQSGSLWKYANDPQPYHKWLSKEFRAVASVLEGSARPLVVFETSASSFGNILALATVLPGQTEMILSERQDIPQLIKDKSSSYPDIVIIKTSAGAIENLDKSDYKEASLPESIHFYPVHLTRPSKPWTGIQQTLP